MSLRAMNLEDAKRAKRFVEKYGKTARLKDLNEFRAAEKEGVSFILARATKVKRGEFDFTLALTAAEAVLAGNADPSAPAKAVKTPKVAATKSDKPKAVKAPKAVKTVKAKSAKTKSAPKAAKVAVEVKPAKLPQAEIDEIKQVIKDAAEAV